MKLSLLPVCALFFLAACSSTNSAPPTTPALTNASTAPQDCTGVGGPTDPERNETRLGQEPTTSKRSKVPSCN